MSTIAAMASRGVASVSARGLAYLALFGAVVLGVTGTWSQPAFGASGPAWEIQSIPLPTNFTREDSAKCSATSGCDAYEVTVTNVGNAPSSGLVVVRDVLPAGIVTAPNNGTFGGVAPALPYAPLPCNEDGVPVDESTVTCDYEGEGIPPGGTLTIGIEVLATSEAAASLSNFAEVRGGGAPTAVTSPPGTVANDVAATAATQFNVQSFTAGVFGVNGAQDEQAGAHPDSIATTVDFTTVLSGTVEKRTNFEDVGVQEPKTEIVELPLGLVGDPLAARECTEAELRTVERHPERCPAGSQVGIVTVDAGAYSKNEGKLLYNMVPEPGYPAEFGFEFDETLFYLRASVVPSPAGYELRVTVPDIGRARPTKVTGVTVVFFGDPTTVDGSGGGEAFLTNPDDCGFGSSAAHLEADSWVDSERWVSAEAQVFDGGVSGCGLLQFEPSIQVAPEESRVDTPSGYEVDLKVPQSRNAPGILATPDLRDAVVSLPEGVSISPAAANGLEACQETGPEGLNITHGWEPTGAQPLDPADPEAMEIGEDGLTHVAPGHCPAASQIGEVEVVTPVLASPLHGHVYVAAPSCGGEHQPACTEASATNGELYGLFLEVAGSGVIVKLRGTVSANPVTGQLTTSFKENPQLPFSELKLKLEGGPLAALANPQSCGSFVATSDLTPWSAPTTADATPFSPAFSVEGCGAGATAGFAPSFQAGTTSVGAATSTALSTSFSRVDGEQDLAGVSVVLPPGLVGLLSEVPLCGEPQAAEGSCGEASRIGSTTVAAGAGPDPYWETGSVYLTGPYGGAPFGLSVVVPAKAGPFNLGDVVVRASINVNPLTTAVTVTSARFPQIVDGVPLRVKTVNVLVNRPGFMLNPTNCEKQSIAGTLASAQGATVGVSSPFAVEGCKDLAFKPMFSASTQGHASKADGASLDVRVSYPQGGEANIRSVKTSLPLQLPSRLTTLQKACTAAVFEANPAGCPAESIVGIAKANSPVLPVPLTGPAYLVAHGNEAFPNLVIVLEGDGVRVDLVGTTNIKRGITTQTFKSVPDDPVSSFELYLPEGKYSILATNLPFKAKYNFCGRKLVMPTEIVGQNGAVIKQSTQIAVTGCKKAKPTKKTKKKTGKKAGRASAGHDAARGGKR